ncbi:MAG: HAD family hydrolase, partial [Bacillota bacterium]|nr:HAD family hydrolase [Bacillota bacterium]
MKEERQGYNRESLMDYYDRKIKFLIIRSVVCVAFAVILMDLLFKQASGNVYINSVISLAGLRLSRLELVQWIGFICVMGINYDYIKSAIFRMTANRDTLLLLGALLLIYASHVEIAVFVMTIVTVGRLAEAIIERKSNKFVAGLMDMSPSDLDSAQLYMAKRERRFSALVTLITIAIAIVAIGIWSLTNMESEKILLIGASVLCAASPAAAGIAGTITVMTGTGKGAEYGIFIKSVEVIEKTARINTVIINKIKTLMTGRIDGNYPGGDYEGLEAFFDEPSATSLEAIDELEAIGVDVVLFTRGKDKDMDHVLGQIGIDKVYKGVSTEKRAELVEEIKISGENTVAMIGKDERDFEAMRNADVGMAIGAKTDVGLDAADIILFRGDLGDVARVIKLCGKIMRTARQCLVGMVIYNIVAIAFATGVLFPLSGTIASPVIYAVFM